jgi:hypothetical protein
LVCHYRLWQLLQANFSRKAAVCVPLLLHCITLADGATALWMRVEDDFNDDDWTVRFAAVERVTMIARFLNPALVENNPAILTSLAHAFCYLISSLTDINSAIQQRTAIYLQTIKQSSIRVR